MKHLLLSIILLFVVNLGFAYSKHVATSGVWKASFYGGYKITANGERFNPNSLTAAHKTLPFGSIVKIENIKNGKSIVVRINNRGPYVRGRDLDLTTGAFKKLAPLKVGVIAVKYTIISLGDNKYWRREDKKSWYSLSVKKYNKNKNKNKKTNNSTNKDK